MPSGHAPAGLQATCSRDINASPTQISPSIMRIYPKETALFALCPTPHPPCDMPSGCWSFTGPWTVTRSSLRMLRRVAAFCRPLRPVLLLVLFPRSRSPVVGVPGLCWMWRDLA